MSRIPRWLKILLIILVVVVVIGLALPYVLDVDRYKDTIANAVKEETGREAKIGKIRARFLPTVGFTIEKFELGNPPGFPPGNFLSIEEIKGGLALGPLLSRQIQITSIDLVQPKIMLLTDSQGRTNYDFSSPKKPAAKAPAREASSSFQLAAIPVIALSDVEVIVGTATRGKAGVIQSLHATSLNAEVGNLVLEKDGLKKWTADADLSGVKIEIAGFRDPAEFNSGELKLRNGALESKFEGSLGKTLSAKGSLNLADIEKSVPRFELNTGMLDLDALLKAMVPSPSAPASNVAGRNELVAQGRISASRVRYAPYEMENAKAEMKVYSDRIEIVPLTAGLYGGSANLQARVSTAQAPSRLNGTLNVSSLDMARLCAASPDTKNSLTGTGELTLQISGPLNDTMLNVMTGTGNLAVRDGSFPGFSLSSLGALSKVSQLLSGDFAGALAKGGGTKGTTFTIISGDLSIAGGRVSSNRIHMDSNLGAMDLRGSFGFDQTLDYDGQAVLTGAAGGSDASSPQGILTGILGQVTKQQVQSVSIPFAVRGTFDKPKIVPGKGIPGLKTVAPTQQTTTQQAPQQKKSLLDLFKKP
jgi:AsmA protein